MDARSGASVLKAAPPGNLTSDTSRGVLYREHVEPIPKAGGKSPAAKSRATEERELRAARAIVRRRAHNRCEARYLVHACTGQLDHVHHRRRRSQGGSNNPTNLLGLCFTAHEWIHANPTEARRLGLLLGAKP